MNGYNNQSQIVQSVSIGVFNKHNGVKLCSQCNLHFCFQNSIVASVTIDTSGDHN